jgi:hypothetical protein
MKSIITIEWDRQVGDYTLEYEGSPIHKDSLNTLFTTILDRLEQTADSAGYCCFGGVSQEEESNDIN